jgi:hypothetical protein
MDLSEGIVIGCDKTQEWLLLWFWSYYQKHNNYPIAFVDFGMSEEAVQWCTEKGHYIPLKESALPISDVDLETRIKWEALYGEGVWHFRKAWFKKPQAFLNSPFKKSLWLDLDCKILGDVKPLFDTLIDADLAILKESEPSQVALRDKGILMPGEVSYNSGVVAYKKDSKSILEWARLSLEHSNLFAGDQQALSRAIYLNKVPIIELHESFNWSHALEYQKEPLIIHYHGGAGKIAILKELQLYK